MLDADDTFAAEDSMIDTINWFVSVVWRDVLVGVQDKKKACISLAAYLKDYSEAIDKELTSLGLLVPHPKEKP